MNPQKGQDVDHINGDGLDCRKSNMRLCSRGQNLWNRGKPRTNTTGLKGVFHHQKGGYYSNIKCKGRLIYLGYFPDPIAAARAYNAAALKYHGEFARLNEIPEADKRDAQPKREKGC